MTVDQLDVAARLAGIATALTGLELAAALPRIASWQVRPRYFTAPGAVRRYRALALLTALLGLDFAVRPEDCLAGGGLLACLLLLRFTVALEAAGDGADIMLATVLVPLGCWTHLTAPWIRDLLLGCLAVKVCTAYLRSGVAKLAVAAWRSGRQVALIVNSRHYGARLPAWPLLEYPQLARAVAWSVMLVEVVAPVAVLIGHQVLLVWAGCALLLHAGIAGVMRLPRFMWAFTAGLACLLAFRGIF
ncbi:hypothetical protein [Kitasatospora viridis]|uniref:hypothetical protein n=1 Tax=Kitasatospora viridis TaxID=281105 RepID=UPI00119F35DF|nr:hypothetical protein [Kitasatospora viridis]